MQYKFFDIPAVDAEQAEVELNAFLRGHRVITVQRELVREPGGVYWALCVEWSEAEAARHVEPLIAFVRHGRSEEMRRRILARF